MWLCCRFVSILLMLVGTIVGVLKQDPATLSARIANVPLVNLDNFGLMFSTALFSQLIQHSVVRSPSHLSSSKLSFVLTSSLITAALLLYSLLSYNHLC